ncbi:MAG: hydroxymethylbilane synthase [Ktedonobacteraceae bacterium]
MVQTQMVIERLQRQWPGLEIAIEQIRTTGDRLTDLPLTQIGGDGVFVTEIERALRERRIDLAVHSLKDLPTAQSDELRLVITGPREDVRDVFISNQKTTGVGARFIAPQGGGETTPQQKEQTTGVGARFIAPWAGEGTKPQQKANLRIGTSSLRRTAQIRSLWPDAQILPIRGNVDTRLRKLEANEYDAIVLAAAGLHRLDLQERLADRLMYFPVELMLPAPGQAALALEIRDEPEMCELLSPLNDPVAQATTTAERMFMRRLGAGCYLPVAAFGEIADEAFTLLGLVISLDGQRQVRVRQSMPWTADTGIEHAEQLGIRLAEQALAGGADEIIGAIREQEHQRV